MRTKLALPIFAGILVFIMLIIFEDENIVSVEAVDPKTHLISITAHKLLNGQLAYKMLSHQIDDGISLTDVTQQRYGLSPTPSIPGPTIIIDEGDEVFLTLTNSIGEDCVSVHVHGVHYTIESDGTLAELNGVIDSCATGTGEGEEFTYYWSAGIGTAGTWPYHDHTFGGIVGSEEKGLFGLLIVNPQDRKFPVFIEGQFDPDFTIDNLQKEYVLYMVETSFWGLEIDHKNGGLQTPLWINPNLVAKQNDNVRFHVYGLGTAFHTFHLHAHRWLDPGTTDVIATALVGPLTRHVFAIKAGESVGFGDWMYHCHVFLHMVKGMQGMFTVQSDDGPSIVISSPLRDDFQRGTTQGWSGVFSSTANVADGGPNGVGDKYLQISVTGDQGPRSSLMFMNSAQWSGDYTAAGITGFRIDLNNLGEADLEMRLRINGAGGSFISVNSVSIPAGGGWQTVEFTLDETGMGGGGNLDATLGDVTELQLLHIPSSGSRGMTLMATLGVDNITAI